MEFSRVLNGKIYCCQSLNIIIKSGGIMTINLDYIEFWATKHCNLNCKGCSSCSPIMPEWFIDLSRLNDDLKRLSFLGINILNINILGGEPLLHPDIVKIFYIVKKIYPSVNLGLLTNGLLLSEMPGEFWSSCQECDVMLKVTCFPVMSLEKRIELEKNLQQKNLRYHLTDKKLFNKILVLNNKAAFKDIISNCGCNKAYNLFEGYVSRCPVPMVVGYMNDYFNVNFITEGRLNIYSVRNGREIIEFLETPNESCKNCSVMTKKVKWEKAGASPEISDWLVK